MTISCATAARKGGWVHRSWQTSVDSRSYGVLGEGMDGVVAGMHARHNQELLIACREMLEHLPSARRGHI